MARSRTTYPDGQRPLIGPDLPTAEVVPRASRSSAPQTQSCMFENSNGDFVASSVSTVPTLFKRPTQPISSPAASVDGKASRTRKASSILPEPEYFGPAANLASELRRKNAPTQEESPSKRRKATPSPSPAATARKAAAARPAGKSSKSTLKKIVDPTKAPTNVQELAPPPATELWLLPAWNTPTVDEMIDIQRKNSSAQKSKSRKEVGDVVETLNFPVWKPTGERAEMFLKSLTIDDPLLERCIPNSNILLHRNDNVPCQKRLNRGYYNHLGYSFWWDSNTMTVDGPEAREIVIVWDLYTGLVRITDMFYCCRPGKGEPNIAISKTPGLKDLCANVTGGRLDLQGYWVPFHAARAIAAHLCWPIRFQLAPIFGPMFPYHCVAPNELGYQQFGVSTYVMDRVRAVSQSLERDAGMSVRSIWDSMDLHDPTVSSPSVGSRATPEANHEMALVLSTSTHDDEEEASMSSPLAALSESSNVNAGKAFVEVEKIEKIEKAERTVKKVAPSARVSPHVLEMRKAELERPVAQCSGKYQDAMAGILYSDELPRYYEVAEEDQVKADLATILMQLARVGDRGVNL